MTGTAFAILAMFYIPEWSGGVRRGGTDVKDVDKCDSPITGNPPLSLLTAILVYTFDQKKIHRHMFYVCSFDLIVKIIREVGGTITKNYFSSLMPQHLPAPSPGSEWVDGSVSE